MTGTALESSPEGEKVESGESKRLSKSFDQWLGLRDLMDSSPVSHKSNEGKTGNKNSKKDGSNTPKWRDLMSGSSASDWYDNFTDRLVEKVVETALPTASMNLSGSNPRLQFMKERPPLSIPILSKNFRRMTSRMGIVYDVYYTALQFASWRRPSFTLSILLIYSYCCLYPRTILTVPFLFFAYGIMSPAYMSRHPPDPTGLEYQNTPARGPPLNRAPVPKPVPDISREFYMNVTDTQNLMAEYSDVYDFFASRLAVSAYFTDESRSAIVFFMSLILAILSYFLGPLLILLPWGTILTFLGWFAAIYFYNCFETPQSRSASSQKLRRESDESDEVKKKRRSSSSSLVNIPPGVSMLVGQNARAAEQHARGLISRLDTYVHREFPFNERIEHKEVEIFEVQLYENDIQHWSASSFVSEPHIIRRFLQPELQLPINGAATLNDVLAPSGWTFPSGSSWNLDFLPEEWTMNRAVTKWVDCDHGEKWVYDSMDGQRANTARRRRWHRTCIREEEKGDDK